MGPLCCLAALGHDGTTYLSFFSFFWDPLLLFLLLVPSHLLLSLQLHISQRSAFGISPLKSPSAVPTAAMTTAGELCVSESISVIVCLIANFWAMGANMCAYSTDTWAAYFPFILTSLCSSLWACASLAVFVKLVVEWSTHVPEHKPSSVITGRVDTSYSKKGGKTRVSAASRAEGVITEGLVWSWYGLRWQKPPIYDAHSWTHSNYSMWVEISEDVRWRQQQQQPVVITCLQKVGYIWCLPLRKDLYVLEKVSCRKRCYQWMMVQSAS